MILTMPIRRTVVRRNGEDVSVIEVIPGFCRVSADNQLENDALGGSGTGGHMLISNPLIEGMLAFQNNASTGLGTHERIFLILDEPPYSNPGLDDNGPSLTDNLAAV